MGSPTAALNKLLAQDGALLIDDTSAHTDAGYGIVIREDTVIAAWTDEEGTNLVTKFDIASATLTTDDIALIIPGGLSNGSIQLTSGSIWLLRW